MDCVRINIVIKCMNILICFGVSILLQLLLFQKYTINKKLTKNSLIGKHFRSNVPVGRDESFLCYTKIIKITCL